MNELSIHTRLKTILFLILHNIIVSNIYSILLRRYNNIIRNLVHVSIVEIFYIYLSNTRNISNYKKYTFFIIIQLPMENIDLTIRCQRSVFIDKS